MFQDANPDLAGLLAAGPRKQEFIQENKCGGYPRAFPAGGVQKDNYNDQGYPWQGIWPLTDGAAFRNHRAVNWSV